MYLEINSKPCRDCNWKTKPRLSGFKDNQTIALLAFADRLRRRARDWREERERRRGAVWFWRARRSDRRLALRNLVPTKSRKRWEEWTERVWFASTTQLSPECKQNRKVTGEGEKAVKKSKKVIFSVTSAIILAAALWWKGSFGVSAS